MMAKNNRLTIRLDDVLVSTIKRACENDKCDKTTIVINALKKGLGIAEEEQGTKVVKGNVRDVPYKIKIDATGSPTRRKALIDDGKECKYCEKCKKFYRYDENSKPEFWNDKYKVNSL